MSLLPLLFSAWWADLDRPHRLLDQQFGMGLSPEQLLLPSTMNWLNPTLNNRAALEFYFRPLADLMRQGTGGMSTITADKDMFKVILDVQQFKPEEITVKLSDCFIMVEAKHEEKRDEHGLISRQFLRKYLLPEQADETKLTSNLSSDGILTITAPLKEREEKSNQKIIKVQLTGKPALRPDMAPGATPATAETGKPISMEENTESREETLENSEKQEKPEK